MTNPADLDAALALSRFGLGAREGSIASIAQNPRGALKEEVTGRVLKRVKIDQKIGSVP